MAKIICDYCEFVTKDRLCYKGGMEKCQGELFLYNENKSDCTHKNTSFKHIRCNVCDDCGDVIEFDV